MSDISFQYDFDPYGENTSNFISNEAHTITAANGTDFNFVVPRYAPFFRRSFACRNLTTAATLKPSVDYYFGFRFDQVIVSGSSLPVYGAIVFNDPSLTANIQIDYQTLGGEFVQSETTILQLMANTVNDPRTTQWSAVVSLPTEFPPIAHRHDVNDFTTFSDVISAIYDLSDAQASGFNKAMQALMEHINDHNNPHQITLAELGIDALGNLIPATQDDALTGTDNTRYMTALRVSQEMTSLFLPILQAHEDDTDNPHNVTKSQVGLALVENYRPANSLEASAGVADNLYLTPAGGTLLAQTVVPTIMAPHTTNYNNPHQVTATQVGLGLVSNYGIATDEAAVSGVSKTMYMTPYATLLAIQNSSQQPLAAHINDHNNPHQVTAAQIGLDLVSNYSIATATDAKAAVRQDLYLSPYGLGQWWIATGKVYVDNAISAATDLTAADIGLGNVVNAGFALTSDNVAGTATNVYVDPAGVTTALSANVISKGYSANPTFVNKLMGGFPAGALASTGAEYTTGGNKLWLATLRTVSSPYQTVSATSAMLTPAPATYSQAAYVDVSSSSQIPGFIIGYYQDSSFVNHYAAIMFKNGSVYLGTFDGTTWTNGTAVSITALTGSSVLVTCAASGTNISVTVGSTTVNVDISSVTFSSSAFASWAGFVAVGTAALVFTPQSIPAMYTTITDVVNSRRYTYSSSAWSETTDATVTTAMAADLRSGKIVCNDSTGESFIVITAGKYGALGPAQSN